MCEWNFDNLGSPAGVVDSVLDSLLIRYKYQSSSSNAHAMCQYVCPDIISRFGIKKLTVKCCDVCKCIQSVDSVYISKLVFFCTQFKNKNTL